MRIALSIWNDRISPVFDTSCTLLIVDLENGLEDRRTEVLIDNIPFINRAAKLKELKIEILLCGAISRQLTFLINSSGIEIIAFLTGEIEQVLKAFLNDRLPNPRFLMPGCCKRRRRFRGGFF